ncbi:DNA recombination protein RmuC [uncultured Pseudokineococcus sp.]|uniref:DNA recombination protein RmuC n=1 Tax=uncultured Pseudokineococcus sp. TaxID=1642928 RepID=UPI0026027776|nr:DNA recombination protein RmuC [uncultured Pseudokineococcus sp.]
MTSSTLAVALVAALVLAALVGGSALAAHRAGVRRGAAEGRRDGELALARAVAERDAALERARASETAREDEHELALGLAPLTSSLARVERTVGSLEAERASQVGRLEAQLEAVRRSGEALRTETTALAGALRSPSARGAWGEVQLRRVVEHAGMLDRVDVEHQATAPGADGGRVRPDAVVRLPGGKSVVVDAKAPLAAFLEAAQAARPGEDPGAAVRRQQAAAAAHARALRGHVDDLAGKRYWEAFAPAPELVVCFVPGESFLAAACEADPALLEHAMGRGVVLATPTTLLALLRTVAATWQQDALAGSARALLDTGRELHRRLGTLGRGTSALGRSLHRAVEDYNGLVGTLERRVLVSARRLADMGLVEDDLPAPEPLVDAPRPLTAPELVADLDDRGTSDATDRRERPGGTEATRRAG